MNKIKQARDEEAIKTLKRYTEVPAPQWEDFMDNCKHCGGRNFYVVEESSKLGELHSVMCSNCQTSFSEFSEGADGTTTERIIRLITAWNRKP